MPAEPFETPDAWSMCERASCRGIRVGDLDGCLAHLTATELDLFVAALRPGADLDVRGTAISEELLERLLAAVVDADGHPVLNRAYFNSCELMNARFRHGRFTRASFGAVRFYGVTVFEGAQFDDASFDYARFAGVASFNGARFNNTGEFGHAEFAQAAQFIGATFEKATTFGPLRADVLQLSYARFEDGVNLTVMCRSIFADRTVFGAPSSIASSASDTPTRLLTLHDTDVSNLVLVDVDLSQCGFTGAHRLDQLRFEGRCEFGVPPRGIRWTRRQVLGEEARWRGWPSARLNLDMVTPERLAAVYRSLRKAFEDSKNEAGAGDFYYGEMEMRRRSAKTRRAERWILWFYWLLSGYGQRGGRALAALLVVITTVAGLLVVYGQPVAEAAKIAVGAVVLREAGAELTTAGEWTVMAARVLGPVLLALAVLAVRARVKR